MRLPISGDAAPRRVANGKVRKKVRRFQSMPWAARSWSHERQVIARIEITEQGTDIRFIVTNLEGRSKHLYVKESIARVAAWRT